MALSTFLLLSVGFLNLCLSVFMYKRNASRAGRYYASFLLGIVIWAFSMFFFRTGNNFEIIFIWGRIVYVGAALTGFTFLVFSIFFPDKKFVNKTYRIVFFVSAFSFILVSFLSVFGNLILIRAEKVNTINVLIYNYYGNILYGTYILLNYIAGFFILLKKYKQQTGQIHLQLYYIILGGFISLIISIFLNFVLTFFGDFRYNWVGPCSTSIMIAFITYAIIRHRLMGIAVLMSKIYVMLIISICVYVLFQAFIYFHFLFVSLHLEQIQITTVEFFIALVVSMALSPFLNYVQKSSDYLFFRKGNPSTMIKNLSLKMSGVLDMKQLLLLLNTEFKKIIGTEFISIIYTSRKGNRKTEKQELIMFKDNKLRTVPFDKGSHIMSHLIKEKKVFIAEEISDDGKEGKKLCRELKKHNTHIAAPLEARKKIVGAIIFGQKVTQNAYTKEDIEFVEIISFQAGAAIESVLLYQEISRFNRHLKREVKKATTDLRTANKKLIIAYEKLHKLDRAKSEFLSIASHQLRTPLTSIKGFTSLLLEGSYGKISKEVKKVLEKIFLSNERLVRLVEDLLNISRIESGRFVFDLKKNNISKLLKGIVDSFMMSAKSKNISLKIIFPKKKIEDFCFDRGKVQEVVSNFIDNALKYSKSGTITVEAKELKDVVRVAVTDNGRGISDDELRYIFEKFQRGRGVNQVHTEGIGLGLYVCRVIVRAHKGRVWAESGGVGKGSTFLFELKKGLKSQDVTK